METKPKVTINTLDRYAQESISWVAFYNRDFCDLTNLNDSSQVPNRSMCLGLNEVVLDSSFSDTTPNISYMSSTYSNENCEFSGIYIIGQFNSPKDFYTTTIDFGIDYPKKIIITYYDNNGNEIYSEPIDNIRSNKIYSKAGIKNCKRITMHFVESWGPYKFAYLQTWLIGSLIVFDGEYLEDLSLNEDTDPISRSIAIDTAFIQIVAKENEFDLLNPVGATKFIKPGVSLEAEVEIDGNNLYLGKYYISKIDYNDAKTIGLHCETILGILDKEKFFNSLLYNGTSAKDVLTSVLGGEEAEYHIENSKVYGYIPVKSKREAIKEICFSNGITVSDNRSDKIVFSEFSYNIDNLQRITLDKIVDNPRFEFEYKLKEIKMKSYFFLGEQDFKSTLVTNIRESGTYQLSGAATNLEIIPEDGSTGGASIVMPGVLGDSVSCAIVLVSDTNKTYKIMGNLYYNTNCDRIYDNPIVDDSNKQTISVESSYLINTLINSNNISNRIFEYFNSNNIKLTLEYICTGQETGKWVQVELPNNRNFTGILVHQHINVSQSMLTVAEIYGKGEYT